MIDIGINLTDAAFARDLEDCLAQAQAAGVSACIVTGTSSQGSEQALALAERFTHCLAATAGVHPHHAKEWTSASDAQVRALAQQPRVVAIGETGLDFNRNFSTPQDQQKAFEAQLAIAADTGLPLFLHERDAFSRQYALLREWRDQLAGGVIHCFTGDQKALYAYLDLDLYIGITGWICDERRGQALQRLVRDIPENRLLIETDAPYLLPRDLPRDTHPKPAARRNEPRFLPHIAARIAALRDQPAAQLQAATVANTHRLFTRLAAALTKTQ